MERILIKYKVEIAKFIYFLLVSGFGFCIGCIVVIYVNRNGFLKESRGESFINGYVDCLHDFESGSFQFIDDSTIIIHPYGDSIISVVINNKELR